MRNKLGISPTAAHYADGGRHAPKIPTTQVQGDRLEFEPQQRRHPTVNVKRSNAETPLPARPINGSPHVAKGGSTIVKSEEIEEFEKQPTREEEDVNAPRAKDVETPTRDQIYRHKVSHTPNEVV